MDIIEGRNGAQKLPWEATPMHPDVWRKLGRFKNFLLALLHKNPLQRPSMEDFYHRCERALGAATATVSGGRILQPSA